MLVEFKRKRKEYENSWSVIINDRFAFGYTGLRKHLRHLRFKTWLFSYDDSRVNILQIQVLGFQVGFKSNMLKVKKSPPEASTQTQVNKCPISPACLTICPDCPELGGSNA